MPDTPPPASPMFSLNEVRSPQERRPGPELGHHRVRCASTKSAPHRSGDPDGLPMTTAVCPPQRSPLPTGAETALDTMSGTVAFMPQRSPLPTGAETPATSPPSRLRARLNEVRSPQERRRTASTCPARSSASLNEVRSPQERRRRVHPGPRGRDPASTKSAPHRSGDWTRCPARNPCRDRLNEVRSPQERRPGPRARRGHR